MPTPSQILRRACWLMFQASSPMGYGFLHAAHASSLTEDTVVSDADLEKKSISFDYHAGRMIKTRITVDDTGTLTISPEQPRSDYQSWAYEYPHASDLIAHVKASFLP